MTGSGGGPTVVIEKLPGENKGNKETFGKDSGIPPEIRT
jgi:hypothetical protein